MPKAIWTRKDNYVSVFNKSSTKLYSALGLPAFSVVEPALREYVGSLKGYRKNVLPDLAPDLRARIAHEWQGYFQAWGYLA